MLINIGTEWKKKHSMTSFVNWFKSLLNRRLNKSLGSQLNGCNAYKALTLVLLSYACVYCFTFPCSYNQINQIFFFLCFGIDTIGIRCAWGVESTQRLEAEQQFWWRKQEVRTTTQQCGRMRYEAIKPNTARTNKITVNRLVNCKQF